MDPLQLDRVKAALYSKHYTVNESWLKECVEFYLSEHQDSSLDSLLSFIICQIQLCDLREINNVKGCLPSNLSQQKCVTLPGKYTLQVDYLYDISQSKYKQLEKIRNVSTDNIEITETENLTQFNTQSTQSANTFSWEPKSNRMIQLKLTDGKQDIIAIEHRPIRLFDDLSNILPGYKVLIKGPVICRRGCILLEEKNLTRIGGEVEAFLVPNAIENVLARALNLEENPNPYAEDMNSPSDLSPPSNNSGTNNSNSNSTVNNTRSANTNTNNNQNVSNTINIQSTASSYNNNSRSNNESIVRQDFNVDDMFDDDMNIDFNALDEEIERQSQEQVSTTSTVQQTSSSSNWNFQNQNNVRSQNNNQKPSQVKTSVTSTSTTSNHFSNNDIPDDEFELMEIEQATTNFFQFMPNKTSNLKQTTKTNEEKLNNVNPSTSYGMMSNNKAMTMDLTDEDWSNVTIPKKFAVNVPQNVKLSCSGSVVENTACEKQPAKNTGSFLNLSKIQNTSQNGSHNSSSIRTNSSVQKRSNDSILAPVEKKLKVKCSEETLKNQKITSFIKPMDICQFLCNIEKETLTSTPIKRTIRARVLRVSKLSKANSKWYLNATLTDDTSTVDVDFSSQVLDKVFGFTFEEFQLKKKMKKQNPEILIQLREDVTIAEQKLVRMDSLVEIEFAKDKKPIVTNITELTEEKKKIINARVAALKKSN